jgi:DNA (cytosine-5)-methyltransferase 1
MLALFNIPEGSMNNHQLKVLDLFSGIGGFALGLERAGFATAAFCEIDAKARAVLAKHWPNVPIYNNVAKLTKGVLDEDGISVDVICGGFPCQDISAAGRGAGLSGERSGLWWEFHRLIAEIRPAFAVIENVSVLRSRGLDQVLGSLAALGYDAEWHCIPASAIGAHHQRDRIWIVAYPNTAERWPQHSVRGRVAREYPVPQGAEIADRLITSRSLAEWRNWATEPAVGRVAHGIPGRLDRLKQLGNAVVPQIPELIGRQIMARIAAANDNHPVAAIPIQAAS